MGFLSPWFLAGLAAVGLPVYVHLLRQHKANPVPFSSLLFFERRPQSSIKHRRLRYLALMAMRIALVALLALAFANPFVNRQAAGVGSGRRFVIAAVDRSFSMRAGDALPRAKREAAALVASLGAGEQAQIMALDSGVQLLTQPTADRGELRSAIGQIQAGDARSSYAEFVRAVRSIASASRVPVEAHLFSDLQKTSMPPGFADLQLPPSVALKLHPATPKQQPNWYVESVNAPHTVFSGKKVRLQATIAGSATPAARRTASLVLNGRVLETRAVDVPASGRAAFEFLTLEAPYGQNRGEVRIDSADALKEDDRFSFSIERAEPRKILFVHDGRDSRGPLYYRTALDATADSPFTVDTSSPDQAAGLQFAKYAFVVLSDPSFLSETFETGLRKYVQAGGSLLLAAGPASGGLKKLPVSGESVLESRYYARGGERFQTVADLDPEHPTTRKSNRWEGVKFYQATKLEPGRARVIARLSDRTPVLLEKPLGEGRVVVFASTFDNLSNDFPLHASFVPFVQQTARYLGGLEDRPAYLPVGAYVELRRVRDQASSVEVLDPDGKRALDLKQASMAATFQVTREGFYEIRRANGQNEMVAVNSDRRESDLEQVPAETLELWQNSGQGIKSTASGAEPREESKPYSLWWYVLVAALGVALLESVFSGRFLGMEKQES